MESRTRFLAPTATMVVVGGVLRISERDPAVTSKMKLATNNTRTLTLQAYLEERERELLNVKWDFIGLSEV